MPPLNVTLYEVNRTFDTKWFVNKNIHQQKISMKNVLTTPKAYMLAGLLVIAVTALAWQTKTKKQPHDTTTATNAAAGDTTPTRKHITKQDDFKLDGLDDLDVNLKNLDINLSGLDTCISNSIKLALSNINFEEIGKTTRDAVNNIDWKSIQTDIDKAMRDVHVELKNIDMDKIKTEINLAADEVKKAHIDVSISEIVNNAMEKAAEGIENAKVEIKRWKDFVNDLDKDGLINKKDGYKLEWKDDGSLYINGKKQPKDVSDKYHKYYKEGGYTISNDGDETESL